MSATCQLYPSDVTDNEWAFVTTYLALKSEDAARRHHDPRKVFNGPLQQAPGQAPARPGACCSGRFHAERQSGCISSSIDPSLRTASSP